VTIDGQGMWASEVLVKATVRRVRREGKGRWKALIRQQRHQGLKRLVGEMILHVAEVGWQ
jgi:hypothetical protein